MENEWESLHAPLMVNQAGDLMGFYLEKSQSLEQAEEYFMSAVALALGMEAAILAYLLVEFGESNGGELQIPDDVNFHQLIQFANDLDVLSAPIDIASYVREDDEKPKHMVKNVVDQIRKFWNLIHPGAALKRQFNPCDFTQENLTEYKNIAESIMHSLLYNLQGRPQLHFHRRSNPNVLSFNAHWSSIKSTCRMD